MQIKSLTHFYGTKRLVWLLIFVFLGTLQLEAQRKRRRKSKKQVEYAKMMESLPTFFINDNFVPNRLKQIYKRDASRIALRLMSKYLRLSKQPIEIPDELVQSIYNSMVAIRLSDYGAIDTIAMDYNVRTFPVPNVSYITLIFEHDAEWIQPIKNRADTTGNYVLNQIIKRHNLILTKLVYLDEERGGLTLQAREPINMGALARKIFMEAGVGSIEEMLPYGDGNDIHMKLKSGDWNVEYSVRFGNCIRRCSKNFTWKFAVSSGGKVTYQGGKGATIPPWINVRNQRTTITIPDRINKPKPGVRPYHERISDEKKEGG